MNIPTENIKDKLDDLQAAERVFILKKVAPAPTEKKVNTDFKTRALLAGLAGIPTGAAAFALSKLFRAGKMGNVMALGTLASGTAAGAFIPDIYNTMILNRQNKISDIELRKRYKSYIQQQPSFDYFTKEAARGRGLARGVGSIIGGTARLGGKVVRTTLGALNPFVPKKMPLGKKVFRYTVQGAAAGGVGYGMVNAGRAITRPGSQGDYNTHLRNNLLAGNISPNEISPMEQRGVAELGTR